MFSNYWSNLKSTMVNRKWPFFNKGHFKMKLQLHQILLKCKCLLRFPNKLNNIRITQKHEYLEAVQCSVFSVEYYYNIRSYFWEFIFNSLSSNLEITILLFYSLFYKSDSYIYLNYFKRKFRELNFTNDDQDQLCLQNIQSGIRDFLWANW